MIRVLPGHSRLPPVVDVEGRVPPSTREAQQEYDFPAVFARVREQLLARFAGDEQGRMLASLGLKTGGKFYGFATPADLVAKLPADRVHELIETGRGEPCSPRPGRPMREWVRIPAPDAESCLAYLLEARAFVGATARQHAS